jgi:hypothetical protein
MRPETIAFQFALIRCTRGLISAWEEWLVHVRAQTPPPTTLVDPDPVDTFKKAAAGSQTRRP